MIRVKHKMLFHQALAWVALVVLSCAAALAQEPSAAPAPVTVLEDTLIRVQTVEPINSKRARRGTALVGSVLIHSVVRALA